jgi:hypothetical protein
LEAKGKVVCGVLPCRIFPLAPLRATSLAAFLSGGQGQVIDDSITGMLITVGPIIVVAVLFSNDANYGLLLVEADDVVPQALAEVSKAQLLMYP